MVGFLAPQVSAVAAGFAIIWALAWRRQDSAVAAIEERDGVRFYVEKTSPLQPMQLVRTPGFSGSFLPQRQVRAQPVEGGLHHRVGERGGERPVALSQRVRSGAPQHLGRDAEVEVRRQLAGRLRLAQPVLLDALQRAVEALGVDRPRARGHAGISVASARIAAS